MNGKKTCNACGCEIQEDCIACPRCGDRDVIDEGVEAESFVIGMKGVGNK